MSQAVSERDNRSEAVGALLYEWLSDTARTAENDDQFVDFYAGVVCALAQFLWDHRQCGTTADRIADKVADDVRNFLAQRQARDAGGSRA